MVESHPPPDFSVTLNSGVLLMGLKLTDMFRDHLFRHLQEVQDFKSKKQKKNLGLGTMREIIHGSETRL